MAAFITILKDNILCRSLVFFPASTCYGYARIRDDRTLDLTAAGGSCLKETARDYPGDRVGTRAIDPGGNEGYFSPHQTLEVKRRFPYGIVGSVTAAGLAILLIV